MKAICTGSKFKIYDDSVATYERLPAATFGIEYDKMEGCFLIRKQDLRITERTYGVHENKVQKVMSSFNSFDRSLGVILSGDKGIGKSMFAK